VTIYVYRGIPGCGKTTMANAIMEQRTEGVFAADDYFVNEVGVYNFDPRNLAIAHSECLVNAVRYAEKHGEVAITNTFIRHWEMKLVVEMARLASQQLHVVDFVPVTIEQVKKAHARNTHGVPLEVVARMAVEFQRWTGGACRIQTIEDW